MRVSTCEKCAKGSTCAVRKDKTCLYTGTCQSFISFAKAAHIVGLRTTYKVSAIPSPNVVRR